MVVLGELLALSAAAYTQRSRSGRWMLTRRFEGRRGFVATLWGARDSPHVVLSVRGTKRVVDCVQDIRLLLGREPLAWREGRGLLFEARAQRGPRGRLYLTGHSIGGAYASALGAESGTRTVTFNAPGMRAALRRSGSHDSWLDEQHLSILNVCTNGDFIWRLSGRGLSARTLVLDERQPPTRVAGVRGVVDALRNSGSPGGFVGRALSRHGLRAFSCAGARGPWAERVDELLH